MINPAFFICEPVNFKGICKIYPPKVKDLLTEPNYEIYKKIFLISQEDIEDELVEKGEPFDNVPTPLDYIMAMAKEDDVIKEVITKGFEFFIKEQVTLLPDEKIIIVGNLESILVNAKSITELRLIKEVDFFDFQNLLRQACGIKEIEPFNPNENPKVKYFKAKIRLRDRVKAKSKDNLTFGSTLASICCMNLGLNPLNIGELSFASISPLIRYYQEKSKYEIDIQTALAGAKNVKPQYWIRNIEDL